MTATKTLITTANRFDGHDDCLAAALSELRTLTDLPEWRGAASWQDDDRDIIVITDVPHDVAVPARWLAVC